VRTLLLLALVSIAYAWFAVLPVAQAGRPCCRDHGYHAPLK